MCASGRGDRREGNASGGSAQNEVLRSCPTNGPRLQLRGERAYLGSRRFDEVKAWKT